MKAKLLLVMVACAVLLAAGCQMNSRSDSNKIGKDITYFKDKRTGICFAAINSYTKDMWSITSITAVPCDKCDEYLKDGGE